MNLKTSVITGFLIATTANATVNDSYIVKNEAVPVLCGNSFVAKNYYLDTAYSKLSEKLYSYKNLAKNWDGYNAVKPSDEIIKTAEDFLNILNKNQVVNPKIMVSGDGSVGLFWKHKNNYLEVNFDTVGCLSYFYEFGEKISGEDDLLVTDTIPTKLFLALNLLSNNTRCILGSRLIDSNITTGKNIIKSLINVA